MKFPISSITIAALAFVIPWQARAETVASPRELSQLTLEAAEKLLQERNPGLLASRRVVEAAQATTQGAGARPNPTLSLNSTSINPARGLGAGSLADKRADSTLRIDQTIERGGKRDLRIAVATRAEQAAREDFADTARQQKQALAGAYYDLKLAQDKVKLAQENATLFDQTLDAAMKRQKAGDLSATDVARIRVDALRARNDAEQTVNDKVHTQLALASILHVEPEAFRLTAADTWPPATALPREPTVDELIVQRPDVRAAQSRLAAAAANRELARSQRTRDVTVGVQYEHFPPDGGNTWGVGISVPLFWGNDFSADIRRAEVDKDSAADALERTRAITLNDIARARADLQAAMEKLARYGESILPAGERSLDGAEFAFNHGALPVLDLLDARRTYRALQIEALNAHADHGKALAAWRAATSTE